MSYSIIWKESLEQADKGLKLDMYILKDGNEIGTSNGYFFKDSSPELLTQLAKEKIAELETAVVEVPPPAEVIVDAADQLVKLQSVLDKPITK